MIAHVVKRWDTTEQRHFWQLRGTATPLDGTFLAWSTESWKEGIDNAIAEINDRRSKLDLPLIKPLIWK